MNDTKISWEAIHLSCDGKANPPRILYNAIRVFAARALHALALHALRATGDGRPP